MFYVTPILTQFLYYCNIHQYFERICNYLLQYHWHNTIDTHYRRYVADGFKWVIKEYNYFDLCPDMDFTTGFDRDYCQSKSQISDHRINYYNYLFMVHPMVVSGSPLDEYTLNLHSAHAFVKTYRCLNHKIHNDNCWSCKIRFIMIIVGAVNVSRIIKYAM